MSSNVSFYQGLAQVQVSTPYVEAKTSWGVYIFLLNHVCIQSSEYEGLRHGSNFQSHEKHAKS